MKYGSLETIYNRKSNNFTLISVIMSILIIFYHAYPLFFGGNSINVDFLTNIFHFNLGEIVVDSFLIFSGFNIFSSLENSKNDLSFWIKRVLKIFPTLIFCVILTVFIVAPVLSSIPKFEFLSNFNIYKSYLLNNIFIWNPTVYSLSDVFNNNPYPMVLNGSIWTIKHIFLCYIIIFALKKFDIISNKKYVRIITLVLIIINFFSINGMFDNYYNLLSSIHSNVGVILEFKWFIRLFCFFMIGIYYKQNIRQITYSKKSIFFAIVLWIIGIFINVNNLLIFLILPYIILFVSSQKQIIKIPEISYTIYIFGFLIQQIIIYYLYVKINISLFIAISIFLNIIWGLIVYYTFDKFVNFIKIKILKKVEND